MQNNQKLKICKNCNTPIYASAKICPNCQAKCKGSAGKVITTFVVILVLIIVLSGISAIYESRKETIEKAGKLSSELSAYSNELEDVDSIQEEKSSSPTQKTESLKEENSSSVNGLRPEFKEAMDSYEAFYDDYFDYMNKYKNNPSDFSLLSDYSNMLSKAEEMDKKFEKWDEEDLSDEELKYYLDVQNRISKKLVDSVQ